MLAKLGFTVLVATAFGACAAPLPPTAQLSAAKAAVRGAQEAGAANAPKAKLHLKMARDNVAEAEDLIAREKMKRAKHLLIRAEADGNLAIELAKEAKSKAELADIQEKLRRLRAAQGAAKGDS